MGGMFGDGFVTEWEGEMAINTGRWGRMLGLVAVSVLTVALVASVEMQAVLAPAAASAEEEAAKAVAGERLIRAAEAARADGEIELAEWIEALPLFPREQCIVMPK